MVNPYQQHNLDYLHTLGILWISYMVLDSSTVWWQSWTCFPNVLE